MYVERESVVEGAVVWQRTAVAPGHARILPDGCMDLIWCDGELLVAGPDTRAHVTVEHAGARYVGLRLGPGMGPSVLGVPAHELRDQRVPLTALWPSAGVRRLAERLEALEAREARASMGGQARLLERVADDRLRTAPSADLDIRAAVALLRGGRSVAATADAVGLSERQLHRRFLALVGYGPKVLARVLRLQRALDLARSGHAGASAAVTAGYADQAHLAREVKDLAGVPLRQLLAP
ncbi:helix-turn-helix domain-containing protein [Amycolatopsis pigmentata]|uniref:Helix-turn-helix domain-containing protein n=1 Tax=Amycolatopsis pigmentata TaxID=450801 RepID=A0ABW5G1B5_9PSEU